MRVWLALTLAALISFSIYPSTVNAASFEDLESVPWAEEEISYLSAEGIIHGYSETRFAPREEVTRGQAALMLVNALYPGESPASDPGFTDVSSDYFYYDAIALAAERGLLRGYTDGSFQPDDALTRAEASVMIDNAFEIQRMPMGLAYSDATPIKWAEESILDLSSQGIINGYPDGLFKPHNTINRGEFAVILGGTLNPELAVTRYYEDEFATHEVSAFEKEVVELTNQKRAEHGLSPLSIDVKLSRLAWYKSRDMVLNNYFEHSSPTYGSPFEMMSNFGLNFTSAAENIAAGQETPEMVVEAWMNSEGHRRSILTENYTHIGIGHVEGGIDGNYWTQMFIEK